MSKTRELGFNSRSLGNSRLENLAVRNLLSVFVLCEYTLADDDYHTSLAVSLSLEYLGNGIVLVKGDLGNTNGNRTGCDSCHKRKLTAVTSHNLNYVTTRVGFAGVAKPVHRFKNGIHRRVKANGIVGSGDIVINSTRNSNSGNSVESKVCSASERSVATDSNDSVDIMLLTGIYRLLDTLLGLELGATVGIKHSSAVSDYIGYRSGSEGDHLLGDKSAVSADYSHYLNALVQSLSCNSSYCRVHTGSVAARGENAYSFKLFHIHLHLLSILLVVFTHKNSCTLLL